MLALCCKQLILQKLISCSIIIYKTAGAMPRADKQKAENVLQPGKSFIF